MLLFSSGRFEDLLMFPLGLTSQNDRPYVGLFTHCAGYSARSLPSVNTPFSLGKFVSGIISLPLFPLFSLSGIPIN